MQNEPELVEIGAKAVHEFLSRRDIMQYLDNDEDCSGIATAVLAAVTPQIEARVVGEIVAWLRERSGAYHGRMYGECCPNKRRHLSERSCSLSDIANAIERGDYKESQP